MRRLNATLLAVLVCAAPQAAALGTKGAHNLDGNVVVELTTAADGCTILLRINGENVLVTDLEGPAAPERAICTIGSGYGFLKERLPAHEHQLWLVPPGGDADSDLSNRILERWGSGSENPASGPREAGGPSPPAFAPVSWPSVNGGLPTDDSGTERFVRYRFLLSLAYTLDARTCRAPAEGRLAVFAQTTDGDAWQSHESLQERTLIDEERAFFLPPPTLARLGMGCAGEPVPLSQPSAPESVPPAPSPPPTPSGAPAASPAPASSSIDPRVAGALELVTQASKNVGTPQEPMPGLPANPATAGASDGAPSLGTTSPGRVGTSRTAASDGEGSAFLLDGTTQAEASNEDGGDEFRANATVSVAGFTVSTGELGAGSLAPAHNVGPDAGNHSDYVAQEGPDPRDGGESAIRFPPLEPAGGGPVGRNGEDALAAFHPVPPRLAVHEATEPKPAHVAMGTVAALAVIFLALALGLYARIERSQALNHPTRARIYRYLGENPGRSPQEVATRLDLTLGTVIHHLRRLEILGLVASRRVNRRLRFFVPGAQVDLTATAVSANPLARLIIHAVQEAPGLSLTEVSHRVEATPAHCTYHLRKLVAANVIAVEGTKRQWRYRPSNRLTDSTP